MERESKLSHIQMDLSFAINKGGSRCTYIGKYYKYYARLNSMHKSYKCNIRVPHFNLSTGKIEAVDSGIVECAFVPYAQKHWHQTKCRRIKAHR